MLCMYVTVYVKYAKKKNNKKVVLCCVVLCCVVSCCVVLLSCVVLCSVRLCCVVLLCCVVVLCYVVLICVVFCCVVSCRVVSCSFAQLCCFVLCCVVLCCVVLLIIELELTCHQSPSCSMVSFWKVMVTPIHRKLNSNLSWSVALDMLIDSFFLSIDSPLQFRSALFPSCQQSPVKRLRRVRDKWSAVNTGSLLLSPTFLYLLTAI